MLAAVAPKVPAEHAPIYRLEAELLKLPQVDMPVEHAFCSGLYARTLHIPAGTALTGAVHRAECFFVLRSGVLAVTTDNGVKTLNAGDMLVSPAGTKRAGVALADCVVTTFHANPEELRDEADIWAHYTMQPQIPHDVREGLA